jgi:hypothetical protein
MPDVAAIFGVLWSERPARGSLFGIGPARTMTRSAPPSTYDEDFFAWTQDQAAALRELPRGTLPDGLDPDHLAEEIEDLGRRDLREVSSFLRLLLQHLLKIAACPDSPSAQHWQSEALAFRQSALDAFTPGMRQLLDVETIWRRALNAAADDLALWGIRIAASPDGCPFHLDELLAPRFDLAAAVLAVAEATGSPP